MSGTSYGHARATPDLPWRLRLSFTITNTIIDACLRRDGTVNRRLFSFVDAKVPPSSKPVNGVTTSDTTVDPSRNLWFRLFLPREAAFAGENIPVVVYFHGGGFVFLSANSKPFDVFCRRLSRELPAAVVSINYRLAPEHRCPSQYDDGFDVLKFIDENPPLNCDLTRCFIAGDSAGGNIAHHVVARAGEFKFRNLRIQGLIPIQPYFGGEERTASENELAGAPVVSVERADWCWKAFLPEGSDRDHPAANVFGPKSGDMPGVKFPKCLVFIGGFDPLKDWQKRYCEGMKKNGKKLKMIEYPNAVHSFYAIPELPESCLFIKEFRNFIYFG